MNSATDNVPFDVKKRFAKNTNDIHALLGDVTRLTRGTLYLQATELTPNDWSRLNEVIGLLQQAKSLMGDVGKEIAAAAVSADVVQ